jgi:hypothetical protein
MDPKADSTYILSTYSFCSNRPINTIDSIGCDVTDYYNIYGYLLFKTNDGLSAIIVLNEAGAKGLEEKLKNPINKDKVDNPDFNKKELHVLGETLNDYSNHYKKDRSYNFQIGFDSEYEKAYKGEKRSILKSFIFSYVSVLEYDYKVSEAGEMQAGQDAGWQYGRLDKKKGMIDRLSPYTSLKNNEPLIVID